MTVALVLVQLVREDSVAAEKAFKEWGNYCDAQEAVTLETLLQVNEILLNTFKIDFSIAYYSFKKTQLTNDFVL